MAEDEDNTVFNNLQQGDTIQPVRFTVSCSFVTFFAYLLFRTVSTADFPGKFLVSLYDSFCSKFLTLQQQFAYYTLFIWIMFCFKNLGSVNASYHEDFYEVQTNDDVNLLSSVRRRVQANTTTVETGSLNVLSAKYEVRQ